MKKINERIEKFKLDITQFSQTYFISDYKYTTDRFLNTFGYFPDLRNPKTFNEKLNWRKLYDRKKIFKSFADKVESKKYVEKICGSNILPKVVEVSNSMEDINYSALPNSFIIKATHGSGWNKIIMDKTEANWSELSDYFKIILKESYYRKGREWCYKGLKPRLVIEELLLDEQGKTPLDYKFFCFNGEVKFIQVDYDRFEKHSRTFLDKDFKKIPCEYAFPLYTGKVIKPDNLEDMIEIAEKISRGIDFIRVDLYSIGGKIYFGELTVYPENGYGKFLPEEYDLKIGDYWQIK